MDATAIHPPFAPDEAALEYLLKVRALRQVEPYYNKISYALVYPDGLKAEALEALHAQGLLNRTFHARHFACPRCQSIELLLEERCTGCGSSDLESIGLVFHMSCAHVFALAAPAGHDSHCPKCRARLDLDAPEFESCGQINRCHACGTRMPDPALSFVCRFCDSRSPADDTPRRTFHRYTLSLAGEAALAAAGR